MYVIINYNCKSELEVIEGIVETYDILVSYMNALVERDPTLKWTQQVPLNSQIGYQVPILHNEKEEFLIERHQFVTLP